MICTLKKLWGLNHPAGSSLSVWVFSPWCFRGNTHSTATGVENGLMDGLHINITPNYHHTETEGDLPEEWSLFGCQMHQKSIQDSVATTSLKQKEKQNCRQDTFECCELLERGAVILCVKVEMLPAQPDTG